MIHLPQVTLFAIDCVNPESTLTMMRWSRRFVCFEDTVLLTDLERHRGFRPPDVRLVNHVETDKKCNPLGRADRKVAIDYERAILFETPKHFKTSHVLHMEWDSGVLNPWAWKDEWLEYDFIGAPWPPHHDPGWPRCDGETNAVGNGGFSLKSMKFCQAVREISMDTPSDDPAMMISDSWFGRSIRPNLEKRGIKFAPVPVAAAFSCEHAVYSGQFGFHGKSTAAINNWGGPFAKIR